MKRAICIALGTGLVISSAAALDIAGTREAPIPTTSTIDVVGVALQRGKSREAQRERIHRHYVAEREKCATLRGFQREQCIVRAHAGKGRALLEVAAPYGGRS